MNEFKIENYQDVPIIPIPSKCDICNKDVSKDESLRLQDGKWYCNKCYPKYWEEKWADIERVKVSVTCPFCKTDVGDDFLAGKDKCPCGAEYSEWDDNMVKFTKEVK